MDGVVIPSDQKALDILTGLLAKGISQEARACVEVQIKEIGVHLCHSRRIRNLFEAAFHLIASCAKPDWLHPLPEIIDLEIENSLRWAAFTGVSDPKATARLNLMKAHRLDPVSPADLSAFQPSEYRGLDAWPGAHRDIKE